MNGRVFVDTNVLVYCRDETEAQKQDRAEAWVRELWQRRQGSVSYQVLQEYYVTVTRKLRPGLGPAEARADVRALLAWEPVETNDKLLEDAWRIEDRFGLSWWDSLIVAAAQASGANYLLSEDLQHDLVLDGVKVCNPFRQVYIDLP